MSSSAPHSRKPSAYVPPSMWTAKFWLILACAFPLITGEKFGKITLVISISGAGSKVTSFMLVTMTSMRMIRSGLPVYTVKISADADVVHTDQVSDITDVFWKQTWIKVRLSNRKWSFEVDNKLKDVYRKWPVTVAERFEASEQTDPQWQSCLRPIACWHCGFESRREHGCLSFVNR